MAAAQPGRHELGQWFTPPAVVDLAIRLAIGDGRDAGRVLDPTCGDGEFLAGLARQAVPGSSMWGVDIDASVVPLARERVSGVTVVHGSVFDFSEGPFDTIVGNPPYVRHERIPRAEKERVRSWARRVWRGVPEGELRGVFGKADLAVSCIARSVELAATGARLAFVISSALIDTGYATRFWRLLGAQARVLAIVDAPTERWFPDAAINAVLVVLEKIPVGANDRVALASLNLPTSAAAGHVDGLGQLARVAEVRHASAADPGSWRSALSAPASWARFRDALGGRVVPLGAVAEVRRGFTTGANDVFYMSRQRATELGIETSVTQGVVRAPRRGGECIIIKPSELGEVVVACPSMLDEVPRARSYLESRSEVADRPTLRARRPWWVLPERTANLFLTKAYSARFIQRYCGTPLVCDQRVYSVHPKDGVNPEVLAAVLNATSTAFALECLGRASMGQGALEWSVADARMLPIVNPRGLGEVLVPFRALGRRAIGTAFEEAGREDRRALDEAVLGDCAVAKLASAGLCEKLRQRLARAAS